MAKTALVVQKILSYLCFVILRRLLSALMLGSFLLITGMEAIHDFSHRNDQHCTEKTEHHLHQEEHHCNLCDLTYPTLSQPTILTTSFLQEIFLDKLTGISHRFYFFQNTYNNTLRGPPAFS